MARLVTGPVHGPGLSPHGPGLSRGDVLDSGEAVQQENEEQLEEVSRRLIIREEQLFTQDSLMRRRRTSYRETLRLSDCR
ncbi:hypothetical protein D9C73_027622 [Collichthys lucidus]|uniref:Uncharacterized protein n=1 Tax=Collichthys lucidus TaxID=240159 RepID=A0A4U5TWD0_COLLU|nr:hypothetical protein D9C73_027622 [Collichthys lucidus]